MTSNKLTKEVIWSFLAKGSALFFYLALNVFLARTLEVKEFGAWSYFYSLFTIFILIAYSGTNLSSRKFIAQFNDTAKLSAILWQSLNIRLIVGLAFSIIILISYKPLTKVLGRPDFEILFLASIPLIFLTGIVEYFKNVFQGLHRLKYNFFINLSEHGLKLFFVLIFLYFTGSLIQIVNSFTLALLITSIVGFYFYYYKFVQNLKKSTDKFVKDILKYSIPLLFTSIGVVIAAELDTVMLGILSTDFEVGTYAVAKVIIIKLPHIAFAISLGSMPLFAKLNSENRLVLQRLFYKLLKINTLIYGLIGIIILTTSWFFIPFIFGDEYLRSVLPLLILIPYLVLVSYTVFFNPFLDYQGKAFKRAINIAITIIINIILNFVLIPKYGAIGAAFATSISFIPYVILNYIEVKKVLKEN